MDKLSATWYCAVRRNTYGREYLDILSAKWTRTASLLRPDGGDPVIRFVSLIVVEEETIKEESCN